MEGEWFKDDYYRVREGNRRILFAPVQCYCHHPTPLTRTVAILPLTAYKAVAQECGSSRQGYRVESVPHVDGTAAADGVGDRVVLDGVVVPAVHGNPVGQHGHLDGVAADHGLQHIRSHHTDSMLTIHGTPETSAYSFHKTWMR